MTGGKGQYVMLNVYIIVSINTIVKLVHVVRREVFNILQVKKCLLWLFNHNGILIYDHICIMWAWHILKASYYPYEQVLWLFNHNIIVHLCIRWAWRLIKPHTTRMSKCYGYSIIT